MSSFRSRLPRRDMWCCPQLMPVSVAPAITLAKRVAPRPLCPVDLPFGYQPPDEPCPPAIVPIVVGEYPPDRVVRPGDILANASGWLPPGYLLCDGSAVLRSVYPTLFRIIGTYYGDGGDGTDTKFNLPKLDNCENPNVEYIIKYDLWEHPYCPPQPCSGEPMPVEPTTIDIMVLPYPIQFTPPPGTILQTTVQYLPDGYLYCNGDEVSRTQYALLYNMIGTYYGIGDGISTFNLPNLTNACNPAIRFIIRYAEPDSLTVVINPNIVLNDVTLTNAAVLELI